MRKNYLYTDLQNHLFVPIFMETIDLYMKYRMINPNDFVVYQVMMRFLCRDKSNKNFGFTYITNSGISAITGVSAPTVAKSIKNLNKVGLICIHDNPYKQGKYQQYRYSIFEPLPKEYFFKEFNIEPITDPGIDETNYSQPNIIPQDNLNSENPFVKPFEEEEEQLVKKDKLKAKTKAKKANKKAFHEKEVEDWNYNDFISYFCYKYNEAYGTEYRIASKSFAMENARLKKCCTDFFKGDKLAFMFYIEEMFKKRAQFENTKYPTLSLGTVCTFTNNFKLDKFMKMSLLHRNENSDVQNIDKDVKKLENNEDNMLQSIKEDKNEITISMSEEDKKAFTELKSLFN